MFAKWINEDGRFSFSRNDNGGVEITAATHEALLLGIPAGKIIVKDAGGFPVLVDRLPLTDDAIRAIYETALDRFLDSVAQQYSYADRTRLALRAGYPNQHQALASAFGTWMDRCNDMAKQLYIDVTTGQAELPALDAFIASLPKFNSPS